MAIIKDHIPIYREIFRLSDVFREPVLTFGYQDILGKDIPKDFNYQDFKQLLLARGAKSIATLDPFDNRSDLKYDMNLPIPESEYEKYHTLIDIGSLEHVFDTKQCLENCMRMIKVGGYYFLHTPVNGWLYHGFHTFNPHFIIDAFKQNNFNIKYLKYSSQRGIPIKTPDQDSNAIIWIVGQKTVSIKQFQIPQQENWPEINRLLSSATQTKKNSFLLPVKIEYWFQQLCPPLIFRLLKKTTIKIRQKIGQKWLRNS
ncbi:MAG: hypothetical protein ABH822_00225 [Patescibacteria group bacterium]